MSPDQIPPSDKGDDTKKLYMEPKLIEYGSISKLTQNNAGSFADNSGPQMMMGACL